MNKLFTPYKFNENNELKNRLAVAPMTTSQSNSDGTLSTQEAEWLERLSTAGYGMVISCAAAISQDSIAFENQLSFEKDSDLQDLKALAERMKKHQSINVIQLCHAGSRAIKAEPVSASSYSMPEIPGFVSPRELTKEQIAVIVNDFAEACKRVEATSFNGVEFHGANGYLFTQFFSQMTNLRSDEYGGELPNRARFALEVVQACRKATSPDFLLGFRMSFENAGLETGLDIDENIQIANWLIAEGIDYVHISSLDFRTKSIKYPEQNALQYIKGKLNNRVPLVGVGGIFSVTDALTAMDYGADIVAIGRAAIGNRNLPAIFTEGKDLSAYTPFTESDLKELGISPDFINYLRKMPVAALNVVK